jgi:hypothetical protein
MATSAQMLLAGLALLTDTVVLLISAIWGSAVLKPLLTWYYSFQYAAPPVIDPGLIWWVFPVYYAMLIGMWFALVISLYYMVIQKVDYGYGG